MRRKNTRNAASGAAKKPVTPPTPTASPTTATSKRARKKAVAVGPTPEPSADRSRRAPDVRVLRLRNLAALKNEAVQELLIRGLHNYAGSLDPAVVPQMVKAVGQAIGDERHAVLVGLQDDKLLSFAIVTTPSRAFDLLPQVAHFYNTGSNALKRAMIDRIVEFVSENGYSSFLAVNATGSPDSVWARAFHRAGKARVVGSILEFEVGKRRSE